MKLRRHFSPFLIFLVIAVASYHFYNWFDDAPLRSFLSHRKVHFTLRDGENQKREISFSLLHFPLEFPDPASLALSRVGRTAKYFLNEIPSEHVRLIENGRQRLFFRWVFHCLGTQCVERIKQRHWPSAVKFVDWARSYGAIPVLLTVPHKAYVEYWGEKNAPSASIFVDSQSTRSQPFAASYQTVIDSFPNESPNLLPLFVKYRKLPNAEALYLPYDHHWTPRAMIIAVEAIKQNLRQRGVFVPDSQLVREKNLKNIYMVSQIIKLGLLQSLLPYLPSFQFEFPRYSYKPEPRTNGRVIVFGTSFSQMYRAHKSGLATLLGNALGREPLDYAVSGGGLDGGLLQWEHKGQALQPGDIAVWEIPNHDVGVESKWHPRKPIPSRRDISVFPG